MAHAKLLRSIEMKFVKAVVLFAFLCSGYVSGKRPPNLLPIDTGSSWADDQFAHGIEFIEIYILL